eukprot:PLAT11044.1.p1 GENE.PLAT11044.1~~PLAT11044.1.p1  ORF type:complete len:1083 (-),score=550.00 PLAT11044.1:174-3422(-)
MGNCVPCAKRAPVHTETGEMDHMDVVAGSVLLGGSRKMILRRSTRNMEREYQTQQLLERLRSKEDIGVPELYRMWGQRNETWRAYPEVYEEVGSRLQKKGEPLLACDVIGEALRDDKNRHNLVLMQVQARSLAQTGSTTAAISILEELTDAGADDADTLGGLARCYKDLAEKARTSGEAEEYLRKSYKMYHSAFVYSGRTNHYVGINTASMALLLGDVAEARAVAAEVEMLCQKELKESDDGGNYWLLATLGEAHVVMGNLEEAARYYELAVLKAERNYSILSSTRRQLKKLLDTLVVKRAESRRMSGMASPLGAGVSSSVRGPPSLGPKALGASSSAISARAAALAAASVETDDSVPEGSKAEEGAEGEGAGGAPSPSPAPELLAADAAAADAEVAAAGSDSAALRADFSSCLLEVSSRLHEAWRESRLQGDGSYEPRIKLVGGKEYDLANLKFAELPPAYQEENWESARIACEELLRLAEEGVDLSSIEAVQRGASAVHDAWLVRNYASASDVQRKPFYDLPESEQEKDLRIVRSAREALAAFSELTRAPAAARAMCADLRFSPEEVARDAESPVRYLLDIFEMPKVMVCISPLMRRATALPDDFESSLRRQFTEAIDAANAGFGFAMASPADIIFHECMLERGGEVFVILPIPRDKFVEECVKLYPHPMWKRRFESVLAHASKVHCTNDMSIAMSAVNYHYAAHILSGLGMLKANSMGSSIARVSVELVFSDDARMRRIGDEEEEEDDEDSDEEAGERRSLLEHKDAEPGTSSEHIKTYCWYKEPWALEVWRSQGLPYSAVYSPVLSVQKDRKLVRTFRRSMEHKKLTLGHALGINPKSIPQIMMGILFADVVGYSKLQEVEVLSFITLFLGAVSTLIDACPEEEQPVVRNTWGDAFYFVFPHVDAAGKFALKLSDLTTQTDWGMYGLPSLSIRVSLHAAPVFPIEDPVIRGPNFTGVHTSRAARIEPITPPGSVYCSQAFAAIAQHLGVRAFRSSYVGNVRLAKKYGLQPIFHVQWASLQEQRMTFDGLRKPASKDSMAGVVSSTPKASLTEKALLGGFSPRMGKSTSMSHLPPMRVS